MQVRIGLYEDIVHRVTILCKMLQIKTGNRLFEKGRPLAINVNDILALSLFKQQAGIPTKITVYRMFILNCSYKTFVVNVNRCSLLATRILMILIKLNQPKAHPIKHTDSTDIPVSSVRKAAKHKTMKFFARWGKTGKGWFYGLKLHITADLSGKLLALKLTPGNTDDRKVFFALNKDLDGFFITDAGYISKELEKAFDNEKRIILAIPRANMKKLLTEWQYTMIQTRMRIELHFRNLKLFYGLITNMPRSDNGYFANYLYSILAYLVV
ncbi:MAG: transposase [Candidatus Portnoybacteria bacterium]|nr:transposase [Candidatus Portnoybacteria bacterium]